MNREKHRFMIPIIQRGKVKLKETDPVTAEISMIVFTTRRETTALDDFRRFDGFLDGSHCNTSYAKLKRKVLTDLFREMDRYGKIVGLIIQPHEKSRIRERR